MIVYLCKKNHMKEYLGDAILSATIAVIYERFPER